MSFLRRTSIPLAALVVAAVAPTPAGAVGWVTGEPLSPAGREAISPMLGVTASGERIAAWDQRQRDGSGSKTEGIAVRIAPAGGGFGPAQMLGDANEFDPVLATGNDDNAALAWLGDGKLHIARRAPGASAFTEAAPLPLASGADTPLRVAVQGGDVYVAFATREFPGNNIFKTTIRAARLPAGATTVEALPGAGPGGVIDSASFNENTEADHEVDDPSLAIGAGGVHVAWEDLQDPHANVVDGITTVRRSVRPIGGGNFSAPVNVDTVVTTRFRAEGVTPRVVAAAGQVRVAYSRGEANAVAAKSVAGNGVDQSIPTTGFPFNVQAGIDRAGTLVLGWDQVVPNQFADGVFGARLPASDTTAGSTLLTRRGTSSTLDALAVGADGTAIALPDLRDDSSNDDQASQVQASFLAPGGVFGDREEVSGLQDRVGSGRFDPAVGAVGSDGRAFAVWAADDGSGAAADRVFFSERDATAPVISGITVPAGAVSGTPLAFAASTSDALSPVTLTWDFGDGSHARGGLVGHTYGAPGTYSVTLTARDGAGNVTTESRTVVIQPVPSETGGGPDGPDRTAPKVTGLKSAHPAFRVGSRATSVVGARKKSPAGTTFTLNVDERSTLVVSFRGKAGHKRLTVPGVLVRGGRGPGTVSIPFSGRVGSTRLKPGSYVASLTAIDGAGNRSRSANVSFKVVSR